MKIFKDVGLLIASLVIAYVLSPFAGALYENIFQDSGSYVDVSAIIGLPLAYIFFLTLLFTAFGGAKKPLQEGRDKYWWIGIGLIPAAAFELYFDLSHIYFPLALGLLGWAIGLGIKKVIK